MTAYSLPEWAMWVRAIRANPEDDAPRLECADWLDEHAGTVPCDWCRGTGEDRPPEPVKTPDGRTFVYTGPLGPCPKCKGSRYQSDGVAERAEFVRLSVKLARAEKVMRAPALAGAFPPGAMLFSQRKKCRERIQELWPRVVGPLTDAVFASPYLQIERGFVESVSCPAAVWLSHGDTLYAREPVREVTLTTSPDWQLAGWVRPNEFIRATYQLPGSQKRHDLDRPLPFAEGCRWLLGQEWPGVTFTLPGTLLRGDTADGFEPGPLAELRTYFPGVTDFREINVNRPYFRHVRPIPDVIRWDQRPLTESPLEACTTQLATLMLGGGSASLRAGRCNCGIVWHTPLVTVDYGTHLRRAYTFRS